MKKAIIEHIRKGETQEALDKINRLIKEGKGNLLYEDGSRVLRTACKYGNVEVAKAVLPFSDIDAEQGQPLYFAVKNNNPQLVRLLLDQGADVELSEALEVAKGEIEDMLEEALVKQRQSRYIKLKRAVNKVKGTFPVVITTIALTSMGETIGNVTATYITENRAEIVQLEKANTEHSVRHLNELMKKTDLTAEEKRLIEEFKQKLSSKPEKSYNQNRDNNNDWGMSI